MRKYFLAIAMVCVSMLIAVAQNKKVAVINIETEIGSTSWRYLGKGLAMANDANVDGVLLHLSPYR